MKSSGMEKKTPEAWDMVIEPRTGLPDIPLKEIWRYRDLLTMFVKRDVITVYKQTLLGPIWYVLQPILTTLVYTVIFGKVARLGTDGIPHTLFYLSGIVIWNFFAESFNSTSKTFKDGANLFGKIYFPRLIVPLSKVVSALIKFTIQFVLLLLVLSYFIWKGDESISPNSSIILLPVLLFSMAALGLGFGLIFTSLTVKYRDLNFVIQFGVQLLMYVSPIIYPVSSIPDKYQGIFSLNPITPIVEGFRHSLFGIGSIDVSAYLYSLLVSVSILITGVFIFSRTEKNFIDTV